MPKRYRFRKCYVICRDKEIFGNITTQTIYRDREFALERCSYDQNKAVAEANMDYNKGKPIPVLRVHGFYLVHESLFDELLQQHHKK